MRVDLVIRSSTLTLAVVAHTQESLFAIRQILTFLESTRRITCPCNYAHIKRARTQEIKKIKGNYIMVEVIKRKRDVESVLVK